MSYVYYHERFVLLDKSWRWKYTGIPWLSCRNGMRDLAVVGLHAAWRGEDGCDVKTGELWQGWQVSQDKSSGLAEFWCKFVEIVSKSITSSCNTTTYLNVERRNRKTEYLWYWRWCAGYRIWFDTWEMLVTGPNDLFQPCPRSHQVRLRVGGGFTFCASPPFNTLSTGV